MSQLPHPSPEKSCNDLHLTLNPAMTRLCGRPLSEEDYAIISEQYTRENRNYHGMTHAIKMGDMTAAEKGKFARDIGNPDKADGLESVINVAGAFHDNIYLQVDGDVSVRVKAVLGKYVDITNEADKSTDIYGNNNEYRIKPAGGQTEAQKTVRDITCRIFGINPNDTETPLPRLKNGPFINEFLSAIVAADTLKRYGAHDTDIAKVVTMIEGTIPFRNKDHFSQLAGRLRDANQAMSLGMSDEDIGFAMKAAIFLANKDVLGFVGGRELSDNWLRLSDEERLRNHLQSTWQLMPESNPAFHDQDRKYTPKDFREDLWGRRGFAANFFVSEERQIFHHYDGYPLAADFTKMKELEQSVRKNTVSYLEAKIVSAALVEAIAAKSGCGTARLGEMTATDMRNRLNIQAITVDEEDPIFKVLKEGRGDAQVFDITDSPIAARIMGAARIPARGDEPEKTGVAAIKEIYARFLADKEKFYSGDRNDNYSAFLIAVKDTIGKEAFQEIGNAMENIALESGNVARAARIRAIITNVIEFSSEHRR